MKHNIKTTFLSITTLSLLGTTACGAEHEDIDPPAEAAQRELSVDAIPTQTYYSVRPDFRKCVFPLCGGYWISEVNKSVTTCGDGTQASSQQGCYVSELDLNGLEVVQGDVIHGEYLKKDYDGFGAMDTLEVDAVYSPLFEQERENYFRFNLLSDNGIVCVTEPCPSTDIAKINTPYVWQDPFTFNEAGYYGVDEEELSEAFYEQYNQGGALVDSHWHSPWMTGEGWELSVHNVLVRKSAMCLTVRHASNDSIVAWNVTTLAQADALLGDAENWLWHDLSDGNCADLAADTFCTEEYAPLCGTIDVTGETDTYSNECYLTKAVRTAAGESAKATGESTKGECSDEGECHLDDPAYTYVGTSPEQCSLINFFCPANATYFADDCGCGCVDNSSPVGEPGQPGEACGGFVNAQCMDGLDCVGLGENGSSIGTCTCPEWLNCFPGPDSEPCNMDILEYCPDTQVAW